MVDWSDNKTCVLFGDGAGAAVLAMVDNHFGFQSFHLGGNGNKRELIRIPAGGSKIPTTIKTVQNKGHFIRMSGNEVLNISKNTMLKVCKRLIKQAGISNSQIDFFIPQQTNKRIIKYLTDNLFLEKTKVAYNLNKYGNTSSASIPIALNESVKMGKIKKGDTVLMAGTGGGLTWGGCILIWGV